MQMLVYMIGILLNLWGLLQTNQSKPKYACHCNSETLIPRIVSPKRLSLWRRTKSSADSLPSPLICLIVFVSKQSIIRFITTTLHLSSPSAILLQRFLEQSIPPTHHMQRGAASDHPSESRASFWTTAFV